MPMRVNRPSMKEFRNYEQDSNHKDRVNSLSNAHYRFEQDHKLLLQARLRI